MMTYYVRELCQKQHHLRSWRKRHSFDLRNAKHGGGIRVYATSGEAKRPFRDCMHPLENLYSDECHRTLNSLCREQGDVSNTRIASVSGSAFLRNWKFSSVVGELIGDDQSTACRTITDAACAGLDQDANAVGSKSPKVQVLRHESDSKCHRMH